MQALNLRWSKLSSIGYVDHIPTNCKRTTRWHYRHLHAGRLFPSLKALNSAWTTCSRPASDEEPHAKQGFSCQVLQEVRGDDHQPLLTIESVNHQWVISPTTVEHSADCFGAFTMISPIPNHSSLPWPGYQKGARGEVLFWILACCREKWGTEVCKHLPAHPAYFRLMPAEIWIIAEISNIFSKFRGLPKQNGSQH